MVVERGGALVVKSTWLYTDHVRGHQTSATRCTAAAATVFRIYGRTLAAVVLLGRGYLVDLRSEASRLTPLGVARLGVLTGLLEFRDIHLSGSRPSDLETELDGSLILFRGRFERVHHRSSTQTR